MKIEQLLQIPSQDALLQHPRLGASWEGFVIEQLLAAWRPEGAWFWATHGGAELDLLVITPGERGYRLHERARVITLAAALELCPPPERGLRPPDS